MTREVIFRRGAEAQLDSAIAWYESRSPGLGIRFATAVRQLLRRVRTNPQLFAIVYRDARQAIVRRFPFAVYFREKDDKIIVLSIIHTSRDSQVWVDRIDDESDE